MRSSLFVISTAFLLLGASSSALAQGTYESAMKELAEGINTSLSGTENRTILVASFSRMEGRGCNLDETITKEFEVAYSAQKKTYRVLNRSVLEEYAKEHKLEMEGMMDEEQKMKKAASLLKADIIVFGKYRFSGKNLVLWIHADDIQTSEQLTVLSRTCVPSRDLKRFCEEASTAPAPRSTSGAPGTRTGPVESATVPATDPNCATKQVGDHCFKNNGTRMMEVSIVHTSNMRNVGGVVLRENGRTVNVEAGSKECFYDLSIGAYEFHIQVPNPEGAWGQKKSNFRVDPCKPGTVNYP